MPSEASREKPNEYSHSSEDRCSARSQHRADSLWWQPMPLRPNFPFVLWCPVAVSPHIPHRCSNIHVRISASHFHLHLYWRAKKLPSNPLISQPSDTLMSHGPRKSSHSEASDCWDQSRTGDQITGKDGRKPELCQHRMREVGAGNALTLYLIKLGPLLLLTENLVFLCEDLLKNLSFCD